MSAYKPLRPGKDVTRESIANTRVRLLVALNMMSLDHGRIELAQITGLQGAALESCIAYCQRQGWIGDDGMTSRAGMAVVKAAGIT